MVLILVTKKGAIASLGWERKIVEEFEAGLRRSCYLRPDFRVTQRLVFRLLPATPLGLLRASSALLDST